MDRRKPTPSNTMTATSAMPPMLQIPISFILSDEGPIVVHESDRVAFAYNTAELELSPHEAVIFEVADFMANGNTYRVNARYRTDEQDWTRWPRQGSGCRSPMFTDAIQFELEITATPATRSATTASTTSTTVITKKGRPTPLLP